MALGILGLLSSTSRRTSSLRACSSFLGVQRWVGRAPDSRTPGLRHHASASLNSDDPGPQSSGKPDAHEDFERTRQKLLDVALTLVPTHSFTRDAISNAAVHMGLPRSSNFELSVRDLIGHLAHTGLAQMRVEFENARKSSSAQGASENRVDPFESTGYRVRWLTRKRLEFMVPYIRHWPQALRLLSAPANLGYAANLMYQLTDEIWSLAGDTSFDLNYYSKRALLAGVYSSSELFMCFDGSLEYQDTFAFMQNRFDNVNCLGVQVKNLKETVAWASHCVKGVSPSFFKCPDVYARPEKQD